MSGRVLRLLGVERTVAALDIATSFYGDRLGFAVGSNPNVQTQYRDVFSPRFARCACLHLGDEKIWLTEFADIGEPYPANSKSNDLWFQHLAIVVPNIYAVHSSLAANVEAISREGPLILPPNTGGVTAWKFRDPDRHPLELLQFPPGIGDAKWHRPVAGQKTLGIDHSAISVSDADTSIGFYRDILGFNVASHASNHGIEQESLDDLVGDIVDVIALSAVKQLTPHLELLAYWPPGRRPASPLMPSDIAGDRLVFAVDDLDTILSRLPPSSLVVKSKENEDASALIRDPDGHLIILIKENA